MIDLHTHSTFSDGTDTPSEIVEKAHEIGLTAVALTDHDIVDGLEEFAKASEKYPNLKIVNGCEFATSHPANIEILALNIENIDAFKVRQKKIEEIRNEANLERFELLQKQGVEITWDDVAFDRNGEKRRLVGRPHFAEALVKKGYVSSNRDAFEKYLGEKGSAFVARKDLNARDVIEFINDNGAISVLAHPIYTRASSRVNELQNLFMELKGHGLQGIECYHSNQSSEFTEECLKLSSKLGMKVSGGSDYHGSVHSDVFLGTGKNNLNIPDEVYYDLVQKGDVSHLKLDYKKMRNR